MPADLLALARRYRDLGLSVIPIRADGSKAPDLPAWKPYQQRLATDAELEAWFANGHVAGIAVVCGAVSRNLEVMDFDDAVSYAEWRACVLAINPHALDGIPCVHTPSGGVHLYLFRVLAGPNRKLAKTELGKTLIEIRGEGGYVLAPGCPPACHSTGGEYVWERTLDGI